MKRNLLSSAIIIALMTLGATGCDDNNVKTEATPSASSQPATPAPSQTPETQSGESLWGGDRFCTVKNLGENARKADE